MNRFLAKLALSLVAAALVVPSAAVQPAFAAPDSSQQLAQLNRQLSDAQAKLEQLNNSVETAQSDVDTLNHKLGEDQQRESELRKQLSVLARQCLDQRLDCATALACEVGAWERERNEAGACMHWRFDTDAARCRLRRLYPSVED